MSQKFLVPLQLPADPTQLLEAATKQYVDTRDALTVLKAGDTMSGPLSIGGAAPSGSKAEFLIAAAAVGRIFPFGAASPFDFVIQTDAAAKALSLQGTTEVNVQARSNTAARFNVLPSFNEPMRVMGNTTWNIVSFWNPTETTRRGYIGIFSDQHVTVQSDAGAVYLNAGNGVITFGSGTASSPSNYGLFDSSGNFMCGMNAASISNAGFFYSVTPKSLNVSQDVVTAGLILNKIGAGIASGHDYINFRNTNSTIGSITRNAATSAVLYNTSSDYRLKNDLGPLIDAASRVRRLRPIRVTWKADETRQEQDAFLAHEVAEVVPEAITGEKDAEEMQQMDATKLIPVLTAALQQALDRIDTLESRIAVLEAA